MPLDQDAARTVIQEAFETWVEATKYVKEPEAYTDQASLDVGILTMAAAWLDFYDSTFDVIADLLEADAPEWTAGTYVQDRLRVIAEELTDVMEQEKQEIAPLVG